MAMSVILQLVCACMIAAPVIGSQTLIGDDPSLQAYQNEEECFPFTEPWYVVYRNFELDPYFGQAATCIRAVETSPYASGSTTADVLYSPDVSVKVKLTLTSSPGYSVKNVITVESVDDASVKFDLTAVYKDCQKCKVFRHSYINEGQGCTFWKPESQLGVNDTCCDFIFDLLCGSSPKYQIYVPGCEGSG
ncbi:uncharacterized protein LOC119444407 [Dermacentor silvarum]|uniref:uncharacterized protein LOC119444407 n=1 Tax=Dermacentor silvarum TaxID=543639 RepID=UPI002100ABBB|nr:uncharacterized protein LOC119444407 [Dermacentor silvarum]